MELEHRGVRRPSHVQENPKQIRLYLTLNFNEQWETLPGGRIKFGIRGGELRLALTNGKAPYNARELAGELQLHLTKQRKDEQGKTDTSNLQGVVSKDELSIEVGINKQVTQNRTDTFDVPVCQVTTKGSLEHPAWVFEEKAGEGVLKGLLKKKPLAVVDLTDYTWRIKATFEVSLNDVCLNKAEGMWFQNLTPQKQRVLDIGLAKLFLKHKLKPYVSLVEVVSYD